MVTQLYVSKCGSCIRVVNNICFFYFKGFENGFVNVEPVAGESIHNFAEVVAGCFDRNSNFERVMRENFGCKGEFKGIKFEFNNMFFTIKKDIANAKIIVRDYFRALSN